MKHIRHSYQTPAAVSVKAVTATPIAISGGSAGQGHLHDFDDLPSGGSGGAGSVGVEDFG